MNKKGMPIGMPFLFATYQVLYKYQCNLLSG